MKQLIKNTDEQSILNLMQRNLFNLQEVSLVSKQRSLNTEVFSRLLKKILIVCICIAYIVFCYKFKTNNKYYDRRFVQNQS